MDDRARSLAGSALGALTALGAAMALVGVRGHIAPANVALILVLFVLLGAVIGGRRSGIISALVAAASFDFFHTKPYGSLKISDSSELLTTLLLLAVGLAVGEIAARADRIRTALHDNRQEVRRVHRIAELAATGDSADDLISAVTAELTETLLLEECRFERPPFRNAYPRIEASGVVMSREHHYAKGGFELPKDGVALLVSNGAEILGRFVLIPKPGVGIPLEHRLVAVALADQLGVVLSRTAA